MSKKILITGSSRGIGRAIALKLAASSNEFEICLHARKESEELLTLAKEIEALEKKCQILCCDVSNRNETKLAIEKNLSETGAFWGVIANAGVTRDNIFPALTEEDWDTVINTSVNGFFNVVQPLTLPMIRLRSGGRIIVISSVSGITGNAGQVNYSAAKGALNAAVKALAKELGSRGISVNAIAPGLIETSMAEFAQKEQMLAMIPMKRAGKPSEVAGLVNYLLSDEAEYISGQVIAINGGLV